MNPMLQQMLDRYVCRNEAEYVNAIREIMQELALLGLWRSKFFEHAAFYGGTALRIVHGLNRGSEDLDFSLLKPNREFTLTTYAGASKRTIGIRFPVDFVAKEKALLLRLIRLFQGKHQNSDDFHRSPCRPDRQVYAQKELKIKVRLTLTRRQASLPKSGRCYDRFHTVCVFIRCRICLLASCMPSFAADGETAPKDVIGYDPVWWRRQSPGRKPRTPRTENALLRRLCR